MIQADTVMGLANDSSNVTVPDFPPVSAKELNEGKVGNRVEIGRASCRERV